MTVDISLGWKPIVVFTQTCPTVPQKFLAYKEEKAIYTEGDVKMKPLVPIAVTGPEVLLAGFVTYCAGVAVALARPGHQ